VDSEIGREKRRFFSCGLGRSVLLDWVSCLSLRIAHGCESDRPKPTGIWETSLEGLPAFIFCKLACCLISASLSELDPEIEILAFVTVSFRLSRDSVSYLRSKSESSTTGPEGGSLL